MNPKIKVNIGRGRPPVEIQQLIDTDLKTESKTIVGAINELLETKGSDDPSVINKETHYDFPSIGSVDVIYKAQSEGLIYQWNPDELRYDPIGTPAEVDVSNIQLIDGGNANGNT